MPPNYRQQQGHPLAAHERKGAVAIVAAVVATGVGLGVYELAGGGGFPAHQGKCVTIVLASSTGGGSSTRCGQEAVTFCRAEATADNQVAAQAQSVCRRAGLLPKV